MLKFQGMRDGRKVFDLRQVAPDVLVGEVVCPVDNVVNTFSWDASGIFEADKTASRYDLVL